MTILNINDYLDVNKTAAELGRCRASIYNYIRYGWLTPIDLGGRPHFNRVQVATLKEKIGGKRL